MQKQTDLYKTIELHDVVILFVVLGYATVNVMRLFHVSAVLSEVSNINNKQPQ